MAPVRRMEISEVKAMLESACAEAGMTFEDFVCFGLDGSLNDPYLRDLWLIWGRGIHSEAAAR